MKRWELLLVPWRCAALVICSNGPSMSLKIDVHPSLKLEDQRSSVPLPPCTFGHLTFQ
jgi:hypothetical protein